MNPWIIITAVMAGIVFGFDYLLRKKKWKDNSKAEKISLLINMFSAGPYVFLSALGMLWGIVPSSPETTFGEVLYDATLYMGGAYFAVAFAALIASKTTAAGSDPSPCLTISTLALSLHTTN